MSLGNPSWDPESMIRDVHEASLWLGRAYIQMREWVQLDPNTHYASKNLARHRLCYACNGKEDFQVDGLQRPYVGLRCDDNAQVGTADWLGWLCHETAHDFFHEPRLTSDAEGWGDGLCDYSRYHLLRTLGMPQAAKQFRTKLACAPLNDKWKYPAKLLLGYECKNHLLGPREVFRSLRENPITQVLGRPTWQ